MDIGILRVGKITSGSNEGWSVNIVDDSENTGGLLILISSPDNSLGYDDWVANQQSLEKYLQESDWNFEWF